MTVLANRTGPTGARNLISGTISNGATWVEDVQITEDGTVVTDANTFDWTLTLRESEEDSSAVLTLTTDDYLSITQSADYTLLSIRLPKASLTALDGNYIIDIKSVDTTDTADDSEGLSIHWGHGLVTVLNEPI